MSDFLRGPHMNRRRALVCIAGAATTLVLSPLSAVESRAEEIKRPLIPGDLSEEEKALVPMIDMPKVSDDPWLVPIEIQVKHKMVPDDYVQWIEIWDDKAKFQRKARFYFTPANGQAYLRTNIKVAETTAIKVRAKFSKDGIWEAEKDIKVEGGSKYSC
jgi:desulfoferrodoxin (superoxide reductase-like protein)